MPMEATALATAPDPTAAAVLARYLMADDAPAHFLREHRLGAYRVDFYCREAHLVIEVDAAGEEVDAAVGRARERLLTRLGLKVMRFSDADVLERTSEVVAVIRAAVGRAQRLVAEGKPPHA